MIERCIRRGRVPVEESGAEADDTALAVLAVVSLEFPRRDAVVATEGPSAGIGLEGILSALVVAPESVLRRGVADGVARIERVDGILRSARSFKRSIILPTQSKIYRA